MLFRPKHPTKVHVWAGISWKGKTPIVIFDGKMNATGFIEVLTAGLVPYLRKVDTNPKFMQDNDPKHTSRRAGLWLDEKNINWWKTPAESPDLNPIENLWHELRVCEESHKTTNKARANFRYSPVLGYCGYSKMSEVYSPLEKGSTSSYFKWRWSYWLLTFVFFKLYTLFE